MEVFISSSHLSPVFMWVFDLNMSHGISFCKKSIGCFFSIFIFELLLRRIFERSNVGSLLLLHFHRELDWLHDGTILDIHPVERSWNSADLNVELLVAFKRPQIF